jgi:ATP-binding cassette subfamily F protein uup
VAEGISKSLGGRLLFSGIDLTLVPGSCLGLLGPNGSGKTTLMQVLTGALDADGGVIKPAIGLRVATFAQDRGALDLRQTLRKALCPDGDTVLSRGEGIHVSSWARRFLFRPDQLDVLVGELSGGEQARILIAELMRQPADLLILDEPTNDLDIASLEVLETSLEEFPGAVLLVTHDRFMLDRLSTQVLGLDGRGGAKLLADVSQWLASQEADAARAVSIPATTKSSRPTAADRRVRLTFNEQHEWRQIEGRIQAAEARAAELSQRLNSPELLADHQKLHEHYRLLESVQAEVATLYERWAELDAKRNAAART